jgi:hypothetical protein
MTEDQIELLLKARQLPRKMKSDRRQIFPFFTIY